MNSSGIQVVVEGNNQSQRAVGVGARVSACDTALARKLCEAVRLPRGEVIEANFGLETVAKKGEFVSTL